jgi:diacylglycerol kinase (ATP)
MEHPSIAVVVNPERREELEEFLEALGDRSAVRVIEPQGFDEFAGALADAATSADVVAAIGGDGTQRTAAHALKNSPACLAVVPAGTVNLLARVLGIESIDDAASAIRSGHRRTLDTGLLDDETFVLNASTGYDAAVMQRVDDSAKRWGRARVLRHRAENAVDATTRPCPGERGRRRLLRGTSDDRDGHQRRRTRVRRVHGGAGIGP